MRRIDAIAALACIVTVSEACGGGETAGPSAKTGSIGAVLAQRHADGRLLVREVPPGLAAERAGMKESDEILLIDGRDVRRMSPPDIHRALEGREGSTVRLTIWRQGQVERLTLTRTPHHPDR